jgi:hypothetical protein
MSIVFQLTILLICVIGGLGLLFFISIGTFALWTARSAERNYKLVEAVVVSKRIEGGTVQVDDDPRPVHGPLIEYEYEVGGETHRCHVVLSGGQEKRSNYRWAKRLLNRYEVGQTVEAFYNPDDPSQAFLVKGDRGFVPYFLVAFGLLGLGLLSVFALTVEVLIPFVVIVGLLAVGAAGWLAFQILTAVRQERKGG